MPEYLSPGVYVRKSARDRAPSRGSAPAPPALSARPSAGRRWCACKSWLDYQRWYGGYLDNTITYTPYAVKGFFDNGGQRLFFSRVTRPGAGAASLQLDTSDAQQKLVLTAQGPGEWGNGLFVRVRTGSRSGFRVTMLYYRTLPPLPLVDPLDPANLNNANRRIPDAVEDYDNLGADPVGAGYVLTSLNGTSHLVRADWLDTTRDPQPLVVAGYAQAQGGADGGNPITATQYIGTGAGDPTVPSDARTGLAALEMVDEVSLLCVPEIRIRRRQ